LTTDYKQLEKEIEEIVKICESIPEIYRVKCFEYLLNNLIFSKAKQDLVEKPTDKSKPISKFQLPIDVRALFSQYSIDDAVIPKLFFIEGDEIRPIYNIKTITKSKAQIEVSLLIALENTLIDPNKKFEFSADDVRQRCIDLKLYDLPNFAKHFKKNKKYFKSLDDLEHISISPDGKAELAEIINKMTNGKGGSS